MSSIEGSKSIAVTIDELAAAAGVLVFSLGLLWSLTANTPPVVEMEQVSTGPVIEVPIADWDQLAPTP